MIESKYPKPVPIYPPPHYALYITPLKPGYIELNLYRDGIPLDNTTVNSFLDFQWFLHSHIGRHFTI